VTRGAFVVQPAMEGLARIPLLPALRHESSPVLDPLLIEGMFLASRQAGAAALAEHHGDSNRLAATVRGYEIRARFRPTPHGVFAGVAPTHFAHGPASLHLGGRHRARSNPSAGWLAGVCVHALDDPDVLPLLTLTANNLVTRRGRRMEHEQQATPGGTGTARIAVRATDATVAIMRVCEAGATLRQIGAEVAQRWPTVPEAVLHSTVLGLVRGGFLLTDLLPADVNDDALGHLLLRLPGTSPLRDALARLRLLLVDADRYPPGDPDRLRALRSARELADEIYLHERPLAVDVLTDTDLVLPSVLADDAAAAAGVLWSVGWGRSPLKGYHDRFLNRYGPHRFVPLLEVTDPAIGLGLDADDPDLDAGTPPSGHTAVLAALLAQATTHGRTEVVLDAATVAVLAGDRTRNAPPRTAEIYVRVLAATQRDLAAGNLHLAVCPRGGSQDAGSTSGRFAALLPGTPHAPDAHPPALVAELVVCPRTAEAAGLAPQTGFAPWRIPIGVPVRDGDLGLGDLLLASNGHQLILWSAGHDQQVVPVLYSRIAPRLLPPLARFLALLGHAGVRPWHSWSWGPLGDGPFQPRVRYGRTVLAPARWTLPATLTAAAKDRATWEVALETWRASVAPAPPDIVVTEDDDRRIPLDLRRPDDRELLRRYARRGLAAVTEQPGGPDAVQAVISGPTGQHVLEVVVPLARNAGVPAPVRPATGPPRPIGSGLHLPGGEWLSLAIRGPAPCHDELLSDLATVVDGLAEHWDRWFWLRYATPEHGPHLRVRFHGHPAALGGHVLPMISSWCSDMIRKRLSGGFTVEPYDQEVERYGGPDAISAAEQTFATDSHLALTALAATADPDQRLVMVALSAAAIATTIADGDRAALRGHHVDRAARKRLAVLRPQARAALRAGGDSAVILSPAHHAWRARDDALAAYRDALKPRQRPSCASALIHMHANRLLGGTVAEPLARALAVDLVALPS
jgi:lantibiotic biosynthesis protein